MEPEKQYTICLSKKAIQGFAEVLNHWRCASEYAQTQGELSPTAQENIRSLASASEEWEKAVPKNPSDLNEVVLSGKTLGVIYGASEEMGMAAVEMMFETKNADDAIIAMRGALAISTILGELGSQIQ